MVWMQVEQGFSSSFANYFAIFDDFSKWRVWHFENSIINGKKLAENEEKPNSTQRKFNPFLTLISGHKNPILEP